MPQLDVSSSLSHGQTVTQLIKGINKLSKVIHCELLRQELESVLGYAQLVLIKGGRSPFNPMLVLQKFHDLKDIECEFQIRDRFNFISFLRWHHRDPIPNAKTIWDFKQALEKDAEMAPGGCSTGLKKPSPKDGGLRGMVNHGCEFCGGGVPTQ